MFPNLRAEQARRGLSNKEMGKIIGANQDGYERRMRNGRFLADECKALCSAFKCSFEYLFATDSHSA